MIDYLQYFFKPSHLLTLRPPAMQLRAVIILAVFFGLIIVGGIISRVLVKKTKDGLKIKAYRRLFSLGLTMGITGYIYLFFAWQGITLLSARLLLVIWVLTLITWLFFIVKYLTKEVPKLRQDINNKRTFNKYIP
jgi:hypothetical protein